MKAPAPWSHSRWRLTKLPRRGVLALGPGAEPPARPRLQAAFRSREKGGFRSRATPAAGWGPDGWGTRGPGGRRTRDTFRKGFTRLRRGGPLNLRRGFVQPWNAENPGAKRSDFKP